MEKGYDVYISYSHKDLERVEAIKMEIEQVTGARCWMDLEDIESGVPYFIDGIELCKVFLFIRSKQSQKSKYAIQKISDASEDPLVSHVVIVNIDNSEMTKEFRFLYRLTDTIDWRDHSQHDKLLFDIKRWLENEKIGEFAMFGFLKKAYERLEENKKRYLIIGILIVMLLITGVFVAFIFNKKDTIVYYGTSREGLTLIENSKGRCGFIDNTGTILIPCKWNFAHGFSEGLASVEDTNGKWGFIDNTGTLVIPCKWRHACDFRNGVAKVMDDNWNWKIIDKSGKVVQNTTSDSHNK